MQRAPKREIGLAWRNRLPRKQHFAEFAEIITEVNAASMMPCLRPRVRPVG
jgi:hypothetical protein